MLTVMARDGSDLAPSRLIESLYRVRMSGCSNPLYLKTRCRWTWSHHGPVRLPDRPVLASGGVPNQDADLQEKGDCRRSREMGAAAPCSTYFVSPSCSASRAATPCTRRAVPTTRRAPGLRRRHGEKMRPSAWVGGRQRQVVLRLNGRLLRPRKGLGLGAGVGSCGDALQPVHSGCMSYSQHRPKNSHSIADQGVVEMQLLPPKSLSPYRFNKVVLRVSRVWECRKQDLGNLHELGFIAVDHEATVMEANILAVGVKQFRDVLKNYHLLKN